jgi:MFS transporter, DHA1 family, inner membrane transport protein
VTAPPPVSSPPAAAAPASANERLGIAALAATAFALNLNTNVLGALLPFVHVELGLAGDGAEWLVAGAGFGSAFGALAVATIGRRWQRRSTLAIGLALFVIASLLHLFVGSFWPFLILRTAAGLSVGVAYAAASALAADLAPYARRGAAMGRFNAGLFLAIPVGLPLTVLLARAGHWPAIFAVQALVGLVAGLAALRAIPADAPAAAGTAPRPPSVPVLRAHGVLAVLAATMLHVGSFFTVVQLATTWLDEQRIVPKEQQIFVWIGLGALSVLGSEVFGRFADRVGKRFFVLATSAVLVACFVLLARGPGPVLLAVVGCVLAMTAAARTGPLQALLSGLVPPAQLSSLMGLRGFAMQLGVGAFAMGAASVSGRLGFEGVLGLAAGCQLLSYGAIRFGVRASHRG